LFRIIQSLNFVRDQFCDKKIPKFSDVQVDTPDVTLFGSKASSLIFESYDGGRDSKERLTQVKKFKTVW
jgi:hypothetical protein